VGFFVFHMVFASLLMPRSMAYASALAGIGLVAGGLRLTGQWPASLESWLMLWGWTLTLLFTVFLANHIVRRLRRQRRRLERLTRQMEKHQRQLVQHEKMVAMGQMAAGVAHEVSNPLASMDSLLQLMQRNPDRPRPEAIATLREQVSRVQATVRLMRTFAHRGDAGGALAPAELEVDAVIDEALEMLRLDPRWGGVRLERVRFAGCRCAVDGAALRQVLVNLIINALDAVEGLPSALITVRAGCGEGECTVEVSDNGPGVAPTARRHLFEPFFTTKSVGKGTGLGLAISRSLMEQQGARITLRTGRGAGATFCVQLPKVSRSQE
jgi:C4-dicarboxylate-specific signal transduction histidine kinase